MRWLPMILLLACCRGEEDGAVERAVDSSLPGPERAAAAAERVRPLLEPRLAELDLEIGDPVFLRGFKEERDLELWMQPAPGEPFVKVDSYPIAAASGRLGPKLAEGDRQVPEGLYAFGKRHLNPNSRYHLSFNIGYPNAYDRHHQRTGSFIMIHGNRVSIGCLAMTDPKIEEIYTLCAAALENGQPFIRVHLFPFRMDEKRMTRARDHRWIDFWREIEPGYAHFEKHRTPPDTTLQDGHYHFARSEQGHSCP